jgi:hypothetical protein
MTKGLLALNIDRGEASSPLVRGPQVVVEWSGIDMRQGRDNMNRRKDIPEVHGARRSTRLAHSQTCLDVRTLRIERQMDLFLAPTV